LGSRGGIQDEPLILSIVASPPITHSPALAGRYFVNSHRSSKTKASKSLVAKGASLELGLEHA